MTKVIYCFSLFGFLWVFSSCGTTIDRNPALYGRWEGKEWLVNGQPSQQDPSKIFFEFREDGTYSAGYRTEGEKGSWRTDHDKLYTTAEGKKEKVVRIQFEGPIGLTFEMNRGGVPETMKLIKAQ